MVETAQNSKAPIQALADTISRIFVPVVLILAFLSFILWMTVGVYFLGFSGAMSYGILSFVSVLVIACPCALGLATPTAIIVGVGKGAQAGILVKDAASLQKLHTVDVIIVDKTGTLTYGKPTLVSVKRYSSHTEDEIVRIVGSLENMSEHPIAHAVVSYAQNRGIKFTSVRDFLSTRGK